MKIYNTYGRYYIRDEYIFKNYARIVLNYACYILKQKPV